MKVLKVFLLVMVAMFTFASADAQYRHHHYRHHHHVYHRRWHRRY